MLKATWFLVALAAVPLAGQTPPDVKFDTPEVRVIEVTTPPGRKSALHEHMMNRVMIYLDDGHMTLTHPDGKVEDLRWKAGDVRWSPAGGQHISENAGRTPYRIVELELKNGAGALPSNPLDPVKVDAKRYKVEFENPQVRVLRARYGARDAGVIHEHILNRVTVFLTDQHMKITTSDGKVQESNGKAGEIRLGGAAKHREENVSAEPFEVIAVELKR
jgi:quercetin dioxygenase-like cupin family protein